ncbi:hypothetical protein T281_16055 [Rhodomicrobium udaipurense JA643]|uniref:Uncharacterized protein n=1 Tax=Rhodomicrobium udaipurense TaxID=1202716 RepID=A0A8I1GH46_9HYPH|nr:hypothetical protein [Rhodomicrobium udaipurense]KAI93545.1 hypothetical protein T281_16055 [Rhodomicrobium udaipurense JA643]MBJ7543290.1 hypothetical protein [Rhodomicrobium udaipurense]
MTMTPKTTRQEIREKIFQTHLSGKTFNFINRDGAAEIIEIGSMDGHGFVQFTRTVKGEKAGYVAISPQSLWGDIQYQLRIGPYENV